MKRRYGTGGLYQPKGQTTWVIYFQHDGKRVRESTHTDNYNVALGLLKRKVGDVSRGDYVGVEIERLTITDLWEPYKVGRSNEGRSLDIPTKRWTKHIQPFLGAYRAGDVGTDLINAYIASRKTAKAKNATINRELSILRGMLRDAFYAKPQKIKSLPKFPHLEEDNIRMGFLDTHKYDVIAANATELWLRTIFEIAYTWGWRKGELRMKVSQVDFKANTIRLHTSKNGRGREVTMTKTIRALVEACARDKKPQDYLFTRESGKDKGPVISFRGAWKTLCEKSGVPGLRLHDLRRSAVRNMVRAGVPEHTAMKISGHRTRAIFDRYDIIDQRDISNAMDQIEAARGKIDTTTVTIAVSATKPTSTAVN